jgi:hypothetical protein
MANWAWSTYDHWGYAALALVGTGLACFVLARLLVAPRLRGHLAAIEGVAPPFVGVIGMLFALTLAFLANDTWAAHDRAIAAVTREADALAAISAFAAGLPPQQRAALERTTADYVSGAFEVEWPMLAHRTTDPATAAALERLLVLAAAPSTGAALGAAVHARLLGEVLAVRDARGIRVSLSRTHVNPLKWLGMAFLGLVTLLCVAIVHLDRPRAAIVAMLLFAAAAAPTAAIVLVQGNPFQAPTGVSPAPIAARLADRG